MMSFGLEKRLCNRSLEAKEKPPEAGGLLKLKN
jgi:hypothetical protein